MKKKLIAGCIVLLSIVAGVWAQNAASGTSTGSQIVKSTNVDTSVAITGVDINTSSQVTVTHLAAGLPRAQGGLNSTSAGTGILRDGTTPGASELSGDVTTSGSNAAMVVQIEGAAIPVSAHMLGTNSSKQAVAATAADQAAINYVAGAGTANAQTAAYSPAIAALVNGLGVCWLPSVANTTTTPTFSPNGLTVKTITKVGGAALAASDLTTTAIACAIYDGTNWELQNPQTTGSGVTSVTGTAPIVSSNGTTPAISCATCATASALTTNTLPKIGTSPALANSVVTDNGTTVGLGTAFTVTESTGVPAIVANITTVGLGVPVAGWQSALANSSATSLVTLATAPGAGDYDLVYNLDLHTACTTGTGALNIAFAWTSNAARTITTGNWSLTATQGASVPFSGILPIHVVSGNVTFTPALATACATGTATWDGLIQLRRVN